MAIEPSNWGWLRAHIGFVEQEPVLFDRPMRRNIAYGSAANELLPEVQQAARRANAHGFIAQLPKGEDGEGVMLGMSCVVFNDV